MKPICGDTSFLISLYGNDVHTPRALAYVKRLRQPLTLSLFNEFELEHALHFSVWRQLFSAAQAARIQTAFHADCKSGQLIVAACNLAAVVTEARRLSGAYTSNEGHRSFDILHVAAALQLGAGQFLSFDTNQRKLAKAEGIKLNP